MSADLMGDLADERVRPCDSSRTQRTARCRRAACPAWYPLPGGDSQRTRLGRAHPAAESAHRARDRIGSPARMRRVC